MLKKLLRKQEGITLLELIVVIVIVSVISIVFISNLEVEDTSYEEKLNSSTSKFVSDMRLVRNLVSSRTKYKFLDGTIEYPKGGYGVRINTNSASFYELIAVKEVNPGSYWGATAEVMETVSIAGDVDFRGSQSAQYKWYMVFPTENIVNTDLEIDPDLNYTVSVGSFLTACYGTCYRSTVTLGEETPDGTYVSIISVVDWSEYIEDPPPPNSCFLAGTKITMADYTEKNIEDVKVGDYVLGYDDDKYYAAEVFEMESPMREGYYQLYLSDDTLLQVTNEHPLYARNKDTEGWAAFEPDATYTDNQMEVNDLNTMNQVLTLDGWLDITDVVYVPELVQTYNLKSVEGNTFFADGVFVHNKNPSVQI